MASSKFPRQPEKSQATLGNTAAKAGNPKATFSRSMPSSMSNLASTKSAAASAKFSENTEHLQEINSIRKAPVGAQIKRVINLLFKAKDDGEIDNLIIQTMNKKYPVITETFFHESDRYMSTKLLEVARKHNIVVAVVGKYPIRNPEALERTYRDEATS